MSEILVGGHIPSLHGEVSCSAPKHPGSPAFPFMHVLVRLRSPFPHVTEQSLHGPQLPQPVRNSTLYSVLNATS